jgi:hypothetical protein
LGPIEGTGCPNHNDVVLLEKFSAFPGNSKSFYRCTAYGHTDPNDSDSRVFILGEEFTAGQLKTFAVARVDYNYRDTRLRCLLERNTQTLKEVDLSFGQEIRRG